jgi:small subunit ribosomal protein S2
MGKSQVSELIKAGVHFGHLTRKWNPNMSPYIYMERNGIHIINLYKTVAKLEDASNALKKIAASGRKILFVATKKQAKDIVSESSKKINMPYITERWPGGMLTNFVTIRKAVKKMSSIDRMKQDGTFNSLSKKEKLQIGRLREKLEKNLGSISNMTRLPGAIFIVDILREKIAVKEAQKLNIPIFAMVDTNSDPRGIDYVIPANDDASKSISKILEYIGIAIQEGLEERNSGKEQEESNTDANKAPAEKATAEEAPAEEAPAEEAPAEKATAEEVTAEEAPAEEAPAEKATAEEVTAEEAPAEEAPAEEAPAEEAPAEEAPAEEAPAEEAPIKKKKTKTKTKKDKK